MSSVMETGDMMLSDGVSDVARLDPKTSGKTSPGVARRDSAGFSNLRLAGEGEWAAQESMMGICATVGGLDVCVCVDVC